MTRSGRKGFCRHRSVASNSRASPLGITLFVRAVILTWPSSFSPSVLHKDHLLLFHALHQCILQLLCPGCLALCFLFFSEHVRSIVSNFFFLTRPTHLFLCCSRLPPTPFASSSRTPPRVKANFIFRSKDRRLSYFRKPSTNSNTTIIKPPPGPNLSTLGMNPRYIPLRPSAR